MNRMLAWLHVVALSLVLLLPSAAAAQSTWKFMSIIPAGQPAFIKVFEELAQDITKQSGGRVTVALYPFGELPYKQNEMLRVAGRGLLEMAEIGGVSNFGDAPALILADLPYVALTDADQAVLRAATFPVIEAALRAQGVELITWAAYPRRQIVVRTPFNKLDDLKGRKIRAGGGLEPEILKIWGAVPTFVNYAEMYPAAQRGVIDGVMTSASGIEAGKIYEVAPYFAKIDGPLFHSFFGVNKKVWDGLPDDLKQTIKRVGAEWTGKWDRAIIHGLEAESIERMRSSGQLKSMVSLSQAEREATRREMIPLLRDYIRAKVGPDGLAAFEKTLADLKLK